MSYCDTIANSENFQVNNLAVNRTFIDRIVLLQEIPRDADC